MIHTQTRAFRGQNDLKRTTKNKPKTSNLWSVIPDPAHRRKMVVYGGLKKVRGDHLLLSL